MGLQRGAGKLGDFWVSLDHPDYAIETTYTMATLNRGPEEPVASVTLAPPLVLSGVVVDAANDPIAGARIAELEQSRKDETRATSRSTVTNNDGSFDVSNVKPGKATLKITAIGFVPAVEEFDIRRRYGACCALS